MSAYLLPGSLGLLVGLLLHWAGFSRQDGLRHALGLRRSIPLRSGLTAVGWSMAVTALLCWLAVIDVDTIEVLPLSAGALAGGAVLGIAAGLCGFTPSTAFAGLGADKALEALCVLAGFALTALLLPSLDGLLAPLRTAPPYSAATLFQVTLDEPFLLGGGFLGQGCAGLLLAAIGLCIPAPKPVILPEADEAPAAEEEPVSSADAEESTPEPVPAPENASEDTFVALLPGEEPLVVDTELDEDAGDESFSDEAEDVAVQDEPDPSPHEPEDDDPKEED